MAKMQKATLGPAKISGYCGRLKCCLRYEDDTYTELKKRLPKKNIMVKTRQGEGKVVDTQILTQLVLVEYQNGEKIAIPVDDIEVIHETPSKNGSEEKPSKNQKSKYTGRRREIITKGKGCLVKSL